jgi:hypothetical protein
MLEGIEENVGDVLKNIDVVMAQINKNLKSTTTITI